MQTGQFSSIRNADLERAVDIAGLTKRYKGAVALNNLSVTVNRGELVAILGPSGSGKSTLLSLVAGVVLPDAGKIAFGGRDVTHLPSAQRQIGMVFQRYSLFPNRTVAQNVAFPLEVRRISDTEIKQRVGDILTTVGLQALADRYPSQISGGQAQRVAVARALVFGPSVMLMDEPFGALDKGLRRSLQTQVRKLQLELQMPTLFVTHDQEEAMSLADRIVILRDGKAIAIGTPQDLYRNPASLWIAQFLGDANALRLASVEAAADGTTATVTTTSGLQFHARASAAGHLNDPVVVMRPEDCVILPNDTQDRPRVRGRISSVEFLGATQRLGIDVEGASEFLLTQEGRSRPVRIGETVTLGWSDDAALVVSQS